MSKNFIGRIASSATLIAASLSALTLAGCGGGDPDYYGAIAVNPTTRAASITANYTSQSDANANALRLCEGTCSVVITYGNGQCGAVARGTDFAMGWAVGGSQAEANAAALTKCRQAQGVACEVKLQQCNG